MIYTHICMYIYTHMYNCTCVFKVNLLFYDTVPTALGLPLPTHRTDFP